MHLEGNPMNYLALIEQDGAAWGGMIPELRVTVVGKSRDEVLRLLSEGIAFAMYGLQEDGLPVPLPQLRALAELPAEDQEDYSGMEVVRVDGAPINPVSVEVDRAIRASGLSDREVARRMEASASSVGRLRDLFYWGHSLSSLTRLAQALGRQLEVRLPVAS